MEKGHFERTKPIFRMLTIFSTENIQGEYYVPVRPNRGSFEAVNERILTILKISHNLKVFWVLLVKKTITKLLHSIFNMA